MRLGQVFAVGALALEEVGHGVEPDAVDPDVHPEVEGFEDRLLDLGVVEVEVGLARVEAVPVVGVRDVVPGPVGRLEVLEDDPHVLVLLVGLAPHVEVTCGGSRLRPPRALKPGVLVRGVVAHELVDHPDAAPVRFSDQLVGIAQRAVHRIHVGVIGYVVAVVAQRRGIERQQPERVDAELLQVGQLLDQAAKVTAAVGVAVVERPDVELVDERVLVPERILLELRGLDPALGALGRGDHKKYSKSCSLRTRRRKRKIWPGIDCGLTSTKLRGPFHR